MDNRFLHPIESASVDELRALQLNRLRQTLKHCYENSKIHRARFEEHGVHYSDLKTLEDLHLFPFSDKDTLRQSYPFGLLCTPRERVSRVHASSGTTGLPTVVAYTQEDISDWADCVARSIYAAGGRPGDVIQVSYGYGLFTGGLGGHYGAERLGCTVVPMSAGQTQRQVQLMKDFGVRIILVTPSYLLNMIDVIEQQTDYQHQLEIGILGAEPWTEEMREKIEQRLGIQALDIYGLSEVMGPGVGQECALERDGTTLWEDYFYPEIVDPDTGKPVPDGQMGELVFTSLTKRAFPVVRYRTKDLTCLFPPSIRSMRRFKRITGRTDDMLIIRGVNIFPSQIEEQILKMKELSAHYELHIERRGNLDSLHLKVETDLEPSQHEAVCQVLKRNLHDHTCLNIEVSLHEPKSLLRSEGKIKRVFDHRSIKT